MIYPNCEDCGKDSEILELNLNLAEKVYEAKLACGHAHYIGLDSAKKFLRAENLVNDGRGTAKRLGQKMAVQTLMTWRCKDCKIHTCSECLYLDTALDTTDSYDCRMLKMLTDQEKESR